VYQREVDQTVTIVDSQMTFAYSPLVSFILWFRVSRLFVLPRVPFCRQGTGEMVHRLLLL
jgi:hypothetical protein